ncbi:MAG TPA: hypothetical protein VM529_15915 [Gemmata sp.]|jgi:hypothetical protein|nr:hypothetical protein [Gemmata sp.]
MARIHRELSKVEVNARQRIMQWVMQRVEQDLADERQRKEKEAMERYAGHVMKINGPRGYQSIAAEKKD